VTDAVKVELFVLKCAVIEGELRGALAEYAEPSPVTMDSLFSDKLDAYVKQFELETATMLRGWPDTTKSSTCWRMTSGA
jgi:hypothetical protein